MPDFASPPSFHELSLTSWDLLVIGGGITGAGILREAARLGQRVLLVEQNDFASGTSSRSAKLVHGGLHYLARLQTGVVRQAVSEREHMIRTREELVKPLDFLLPVFEEDRSATFKYSMLLGAYDGFAGRLRFQRSMRAGNVALLAPGLGHCRAAFSYRDAQTDDARLVLRVLQEGCAMGGYVLNYVAVTSLLRGEGARIEGVRLRDRETGHAADVRARVVVNATGAWADALRRQVGGTPRLRLSRGSHLIFPSHRLPIHRAVAARHPDLSRPIYIVPWKGVTLVGCTDVPHSPDQLCEEPRISPEEAAHLLRGVRFLFPSLRLTRADILATFAGIRPLVDTDTEDPAKASRDYAVWEEDGLLTVTGGKLTTFRLMALDALRRVRPLLPALPRIDPSEPVENKPAVLPPSLPFTRSTALRILGRYGSEALTTIAAGPADDLRPIPGIRALWGELRWSARFERVHHLDDLLLRRLRIGLTSPHGGRSFLTAIRPIVQAELEWDDARWQREEETYLRTWEYAHGVPEIPGDEPGK